MYSYKAIVETTEIYVEKLKLFLDLEHFPGGESLCLRVSEEFFQHLLKNNKFSQVKDLPALQMVEISDCGIGFFFCTDESFNPINKIFAVWNSSKTFSIKNVGVNFKTDAFMLDLVVNGKRFLTHFVIGQKGEFKCFSRENLVANKREY